MFKFDLNNFKWINCISKLVEDETIKHLRMNQSETSLFILKRIRSSQKNIPSCLRICNTFFTQMIVVGGLTSTYGDIPIHLDKDDCITALVSMGTDNVISGDTNYYEKIDKERFILVRSIKFKNLNIQIFIQIFFN